MLMRFYCFCGCGSDIEVEGSLGCHCLDFGIYA